MGPIGQAYRTKTKKTVYSLLKTCKNCCRLRNKNQSAETLNSFLPKIENDRIFIIQCRTKQQFGKCCKHCFYSTLMALFNIERLLFITKFTLYFSLCIFLRSIFIVLLLATAYSRPETDPD